MDVLGVSPAFGTSGQGQLLMLPLDRRFLQYTRATRWFVAVSVVIGVLSASLLIVQAGAIAHVVAQTVEGDAGASDLRGSFAVIVVTVVVRAALAWLASMCAIRASVSAKSELRHHVLDRLSVAGPEWLYEARAGSMALLVSRGVDALDGFYSRYLTQLVLAAVVPVLVLMRIAIADWSSALLLMIILPLIPIFMVLAGRLTEARVAQQFQSIQMLSDHFLELLRGLATLRLFGKADAQVPALERSSELLRRSTMRNLRVAFLSGLVMELITTMAVALVAVSAGFRLVNGEMAFEAALVVLLLAPELYAPLRSAGAQFHANVEGVSAAGQMFALLESPSIERSGRQRPNLVGCIALKNVTVTHRDREAPALAQVSLEVPFGETVGIVGPSGCGKSTLLATLLGLLNADSGHVSIGGVPLSDIDIDWWRSCIAWVPQRPHFFEGTIASNVRIAKPHATDDEVRAALTQAHLWPLVEQLPNGIDAPVVEGGANFSAGQRQRIALARAFVRDASLVILDEPMSGLDEDSELAVADAIANLTRGRTAIVVSHRRESLPVFAGRIETLLASSSIVAA